MKRRSLLKVLLLPLFPLTRQVSGASTKIQREVLQTSPVRGHHYHAGPKVLHRLRPGTRLLLIAEPENPYDEFAVRVEWQSYHLGYLPRERNHKISRLLRSIGRDGRPAKVKPQTSPYAVIQEIDETEAPHQPLLIDVVIESPLRSPIRLS